MKADVEKLNNSIYTKEVKSTNLKQRINEIRNILNDICCSLEENEYSVERLIVSKCLDELIVEFMNEENKG